MTLLERFDEFVKNLEQEDRIAIIFHSDTDGMCSAVISAIAIERLLRKKGVIFHTLGHNQISVDLETVDYLNSRKVTKAVFVDLAVDHHPENFFKLEKTMNCLVLDHHKLYNDLNSEKTVHIKPQMINPLVDGSKYCASKMCYDYFSRHSNLSDLDWIAVIGVIGDFNQEPWHKFVDQVYRKYNVDCTGDIMKSKFGQAAIVIGSAEAVVPGKTAEAIKLLYSARSVEDVLSSNLAELAQEIQKEVNSIVNNFEEFAEVRGDIIFLELNSKYKIKSDVSNAISRLHPDMTIFVYTKPNKYGMVNISGRRQDGKVDVAEVIEKSVVGLADAKGGGHKPAAAASVKKHDFAEFKKRILEILIK